MEEEIAEVTKRWAETIDVVEKVEVRTKKADISVEAFGLGALLAGNLKVKA